MITVDAALEQLFALVKPVGTEQVPLTEAAGRVLAEDARATRDQPPSAASAMDGYAVRDAEVTSGARFRVIGEAAAGHGFSGAINAGDAVRIFTGAPVPAGADRVIIQEDVTRDGDHITLREKLDKGRHIRPLGADFKAGDTLPAPRRLTPSDIALLASMNLATVSVRRRPIVALIATGDELVMPGEDPGPDQIIASNSFGLKAMMDSAGAESRLLPIARDTEASLTAVFDLAAEADLIVTIGGASVGDHDLVGKVAENMGLNRAFYKVRMRPGKPLMAGRLGESAMIGLPGNPVSAMVCGHVFILPMIRAMQGLGEHRAPRLTARLATDIGGNGPREHYMRAVVENGQITPENRQDSALLTVLARANALLVRAPVAPPLRAGTEVAYLPL